MAALFLAYFAEDIVSMESGTHACHVLSDVEFLFEPLSIPMIVHTA
jgi:hypothetical protein